MILALAKSKREAADDTSLVDEAIDARRRHPYQRYAADRRKAAPQLHGGDLHRLTGPARRPTLGTGDARPMVLRPGSLDHLQWPSRAGNRLRWPDGRLTALDGITPIDA